MIDEFLSTQSYLTIIKGIETQKMPQFPVFMYSLLLWWPSTIYFTLKAHQTLNYNVLVLLRCKSNLIQAFSAVFHNVRMTQNLMYVELIEHQTCYDLLPSSWQNVLSSCIQMFFKSYGISKNLFSPPGVFLGKGVLKICSKLKGEHPCRSVISIKLQRNFIEITLRHWCSPVNLCIFSEHLLLRKLLGGCFWKFVYQFTIYWKLGST